MVLPRLEVPWIAGRDETVQHVVIGSLRADVASGDVAFGHDRFAAPIVAATRVASGWVFVSRDGAVASAPSFTGTLTRRGNIGRAVGQVRIGSGRALLTDDAGAVWSTDGTVDIRAVDTLPDGTAIAGVYADARHGAVVMNGGRAFHTDDGGATWHGIDLGTDAAFNVFARGTTIVFATTAGYREIDASGRLRETTDLATEDVTLSRGTVRSLVSAARRNDSSVIDAIDAARGVLREGAWWIPDERTVRVVDAATGAVRREMRGVLPASDCSLRAWGDALAATCHATTGTLFRSDDGEHFRAIDDARSEVGIVFSDDGLHAARRGRCAAIAGHDPDAYRTDSMHVCVYSENGGWHEFDASTQLRELSAMHGDALIVRSLDSVDESLVHVLHASEDRFAPLTAPSASNDGSGSIRVEDARFTTDGWIAALGAQGEGRVATHVLLIGPTERALTVHALPPGASRIGFLDARHGLAAGVDASKLWRTVDGGATWIPLTVPLDGDPRTVSFELETTRATGEIDCRVDRCQVANTVRVRGLDDPRGTGGPVLAPPAPLASDEATRYGYTPGLGLRTNRLVCTSRDRALPARSAGAPDGDRRRVAIGAAGASVELDLHSAAADGIDARVHWRGGDERGPFDIRAHATSWPVSDPSSDFGARPSGYMLRVATRAGILIERCSGFGRRACELLWTNARGSTRVVDAQNADRVDETFRVKNAIALADGGALVQLTGGASRDALDVIVRLDSDGRETARRAFAWRAANPLGTLGRYRDASGYITADRGDPAAWRFYPLTRDPRAEAVALPRRDAQAEVHVCGDDARNAADAALVAIDSMSGANLVIASPAGDGITDVRAWIEVTPSGTCVRAIESWPGLFGQFRRETDMDGLRLTATRERHLEGPVDDGRRVHRWRCEEQ